MSKTLIQYICRVPAVRCPLLVLLTGIAIFSSTNCGRKPGREATREPAPSPEERLRWFKEAKFGMFIHWGPYSKIAGEWNGKIVQPGRNAEWAMKFLQIPRESYREMARDFNPVYFDAKRWVQLAKDAGMKYLVVTAKHHDGFAMFHSNVSDYNIVDWTSYGKDPLKALSEECRKAGIKFCVYYSHREDWDEPFAYGNDWDFDFDPEQNLQAFEQHYVEQKAKPQVRELLRGYGPLGLIWFDRGMYTQQQGREFVELVHSIQPTCLVNGRVGHYDKELLGDYQSMSDNGMPIGGIEEYWEAPQTMNTTWGYSKFDHNWKSVDEILRRLVRIAGTGGNYLLNVGPDGLGRIPAPSVEILEGVGRWMDKYSESIYGTTPSPFEPTEWGYTTVKNKTVFLHVFDAPAQHTFVVRGLLTPVSRIYPLRQPGTALPFTKRDGLLEIEWTDDIETDPLCTVLAMELDGPLKTAAPVVDQQGDSLELNYLQAITGGQAVKRYNRKGKFHISKFMGPADKVLWHVDIHIPGSYVVTLEHAVHPEWEGRNLTVGNGADTLHFRTQSTGEWYDYKASRIGRLDFPESRRYVVSLQSADRKNNYLMYLRAVGLQRQ